MTNPEGRLELDVHTLGTNIDAVDVRSTRFLTSARVLAARAPDDVLQLAPLLFPVCGMAQTVACARAIERAQEIPTDPELEVARELVCAAEAAAAHLWQLSVAWAKAAGQRGDICILRQGRQALFELGVALFERGAIGRVLREGAHRDEAERPVRTLLELLDRVTESEPALLDVVERAGRASFGASSAIATLSADERAIAASLGGDMDFARRPEVDGAPRDASAYARSAGDASVQTIERAHGRGLLARLAARRADARTARVRLARLAADEIAPSPPETVLTSGTGAGSVLTARGPLVHWVAVDGVGDEAVVTDVRTVAPTDWTFHPEGVVRRSLVGERVTATLARDIGWLLLALDPCVAWSVTIDGVEAEGAQPDA